MNKQLSFYILIICTIGSLVTCKSGKVLVPDSQQTSKEVEIANFSMETGNKEEQAIPANTTKNLKNINEEKKVYKNFVDSIENGIKIDFLNGFSCKLDTVPKLLKEVFPDAYIFENIFVFGHFPPCLCAYYNEELYSWNNFNELLVATSNLKKIKKEKVILAYLYFRNTEMINEDIKIITSKQIIEKITYDYLVKIQSPKVELQLIVAFTNDGKLYAITDILNNKNSFYAWFNLNTQN